MKRSLLILLISLLLISPLFSDELEAKEIVVPRDFTSIQEAINAPDTLAGDTILVEPGTYDGPITLKSSVSLRGRETARTIITGGIIASNVTGVSIKNFTFTQATTAISLVESNIIISNNIFSLGTGGTLTAIKVQNTFAAAPQIVNNTFYQNNTAIASNMNLTVNNNIFFGNATDIDFGSLSATAITFNAFSASVPSAPDLTGMTGNIVSTNPLFVNPSTNDFHLKTGSPCIDMGDSAVTDIIDATRSDMGAYGGSTNQDSIPMRVFGLAVTTTTTDSVTLTWNANQSYLITDDNKTTTTNPHGYRVYYGSTDSGIYDNSGGTLTSPVLVNLQDPSVIAPPFKLTGLTSGATAPAAPVLAQPTPSNQTLNLAWTAVGGATGYTVHYGIGTTAENSINVGNVLSYSLQGLTNGQVYKIAVSAYAQTAYYLAVTAFDNASPTVGGLIHGEAHESTYSAEITAYLGAAVPSDPSNEVSDFPEAINAYPNLPDKGCFIATAAYGHYSAPQVQALRKFRDEYLLTNAAGKAFVRWYYEQGPRAARFIDEHPSLKPVVRTALLPAVAGAMFLTGTSGTLKTIAAFCVMTGFGYFFFRRKFRHAGGRQ